MAEQKIKTDITAWMDNAGRYPVLPPDQVYAIAKEIQSLPKEDLKRKQLVSKLVQHNLRLVIRFVERFMKKSHNKWGSVETVDYLQMGVIGLVSAAEKFDPTRGYAFATYANFWMRAAIGRYNLKTITPVHVSESATRRILFYKRNGYMKSKGNYKRVSDDQAFAIIRQASLAYGCLSLDLFNEKGSTLHECIADNTTNDELHEEGLMEQIWQDANVSEIGQRILVLSYVEELTAREVAEELDVPLNIVKIEKRKAVLAVRSCPTAINSGIL